MTAKIIKFTPRHFGPLSPLGFRFPGVYRRTGFSFKNVSRGTPDKRYPHLQYTLSDTPEQNPRIANDAFTPLSHLERTDRGWIIVRWHPTEQHLEGYCEALMDTVASRSFETGDESDRYQTDAGLFTLLHRSTPKGCEDRLLIFTFYDPSRETGADFPPGDYWHHIVRANGEVVPPGPSGWGSDDNILWSDE